MSNKKLPMYNAYQCEYGCLMITVDVDKGVTPFEIKCRTRSRPDRPLNPLLTDENGECKGRARSSFYPREELPDNYKKLLLWEWCLPSEDEILQEIKRWASRGATEKDVRDWYDGSHLMLRPRSDREPIYHEESNDHNQE
jgi:hypothetical protein